MIKSFVLVAAGGGLGAMLRYGVTLLFNNHNFPVATLIINIAGSFLIGIIMALSLRTTGQLGETGKLFLATGICGGFTTFSAFSHENFQFLQAGKYNLAFAYIAASVILGLVATFGGYKLITT